MATPKRWYGFQVWTLKKEKYENRGIKFLGSGPGYTIYDSKTNYGT